MQTLHIPHESSGGPEVSVLAAKVRDHLEHGHSEQHAPGHPTCFGHGELQASLPHSPTDHEIFGGLFHVAAIVGLAGTTFLYGYFSDLHYYTATPSWRQHRTLVALVPLRGHTGLVGWGDDDAEHHYMLNALPTLLV